MNSFLELAKERYSVRKFKPDTVEEEKIAKDGTYYSKLFK